MPSQLADLSALAIFGGTPTFAEPRHVGQPNIADRARTIALISSALDSRWLTNDGPLVAEFERRVAQLSGAAHCVAVASATVGLQLAAAALGVTGEVVMPSWTFVGTAHALRWIGLQPVFCDVNSETHTVDASTIAPLLTARTGAIMGVHLWGRSKYAAEVTALGRARNVPVLFDAAHSLGCTTGLGEAEVLSFHATKVASAAEGGAILTADAALAERLRRMRNFGFTDYDTVSMLGTNAKMSELSAAMGIASLESLDAFVAVNRRNHYAYRDGLEGVVDLRLLDYPDGHNFHYVVIEVPPEFRDDLIEILHAENVFARRYFHPGCHRHEPYRNAPRTLPQTESLSARVIALPNGTAMSEADIHRVCDVIRLAVEQAPEVLRRRQ